MDLRINGEQKWLKLGVATLLSVGMIAACGDGNDDDLDVDVNEPVEVSINRYGCRCRY